MSDGSQDRGQKRANENVLASKQINVQYKRYYIDVKENSRGRFIKIAELGANYKSRIVLTMSAVIEIRNHLSSMIDVMESLPKGDPVEHATVLKSETLTIDTRRFYVDLRENERGRFVRIAQLPTSPHQTRQQIAIPSHGVADVRDALTEFIEKFADGHTSPPDSDSKTKLVTENKTFLFNMGENDRGQYLRISEIMMNSGYRNAITIPFTSLEKFRASLDEVLLEGRK